MERKEVLVSAEELARQREYMEKVRVLTGALRRARGHTCCRKNQKSNCISRKQPYGGRRV